MITEIILCVTLAAVDGDSIRCDGELMRAIGSGEPHVSGFDTPELRTYACTAEKALAQAAHRRMKELVQGAWLIDTGARDRTQQRPAPGARQDGQRSIAGDILVAEGLAREWPDGPEFWC